MRTPVIIVDCFSDIVNEADKILFPILGKHIFYQYGSSIQILDKLIELNGGIESKTQRFPLIALFQPFEEKMGGNGYYTQLSIKKLVIAQLTSVQYDVKKRYDLTFKPLLYPIYYELLNQITLNGHFTIHDPGMIPHTKRDNPGSPPPTGTNFAEFVDAIELYDINLTYNE